ncbi:hypothetical protein E3T43_07965 [Cryobacterium sp. Hh7]|uniref:hypothetical protein n=1 Tax=Cryobacterium sp. Hh7 TaxID=1259159 RepID=UPI00106A12E3|nr:hypothetical protein [Cryobacterium sp. Hh7]TFD57636.1 hypothetical protein E3T43_07965 [Cryobacterium sp. Hh7]
MIAEKVRRLGQVGRAILIYPHAQLCAVEERVKAFDRWRIRVAGEASVEDGNRLTFIAACVALLSGHVDHSPETDPVGRRFILCCTRSVEPEPVAPNVDDGEPRGCPCFSPDRQDAGDTFSGIFP